MRPGWKVTWQYLLVGQAHAVYVWIGVGRVLVFALSEAGVWPC